MVVGSLGTALQPDCLLLPVGKLQTAVTSVQGLDCLVGQVSSCVVAWLLGRTSVQLQRPIALRWVYALLK